MRAVSKFCGVLYIFAGALFHALLAGISKAKFLFGHSLDVIDLMDRWEPLPDAGVFLISVLFLLCSELGECL